MTASARLAIATQISIRNWDIQPPFLSPFLLLSTTLGSFLCRGFHGLAVITITVLIFLTNNRFHSRGNYGQVVIAIIAVIWDYRQVVIFITVVVAIAGCEQEYFVYRDFHGQAMIFVMAIIFSMAIIFLADAKLWGSCYINPPFLGVGNSPLENKRPVYLK